MVALMVCSVALAADEVTLTGKVSVTKDGEKVTAVKLTVGEAVYVVVQDDNGKKLVEKDGKMVKVVGTVEEKDGVKNLTVKTVEDVVAAKK